jgi:hypothetical protein
MEPSLTPTRYGLGDVGVSSLNTVCLVLCFRFVRTGAASRSSRDWRLSAQLNLPLADGEVIYQTLRPIWQSVQLWRYSVLLVAGNMLSRLSSPLTSPASAPTDRLSATTAKPVSPYKTLRVITNPVRKSLLIATTAANTYQVESSLKVIWSQSVQSTRSDVL